MRISYLALLLATPALAGTNAGPPNNDPQPRAAPAMVNVGPGTTDPSPRQLVRTSHDVLYVVAPNGTSYASAPTTPQLVVWKANKAATPTRFAAQDSAHAPGGGVNASASAIDGSDRIHSVWITPGAATYGVFDTGTGLWQAPILLESTGWTQYTQGDEGAAVAVNAAGVPYAVWNYVEPGSGALRLHLAIMASNGSFGTPMQVDDIDTNGGARHPSVAFAPSGDFTVAWIDGDGGYSSPGLVRSRTLHANGTWDASITVPNETAGSSLDQSCSLLIGANGVRHLTFLNDQNVIRYYYDLGQGWRGDQQPPTQVTHDPVLGPDGAGGLYIYGHATPIGPISGLGDGKLRFHKAAGSTQWSSYNLIRDGYIDDASNARWSQFFHNFPREVDFTWWNHNPQHTPSGDGAGYFIETGVQTTGAPIRAGAIDLLPNADNNNAGTAEAFAATTLAAGSIAKLGWFLDDPNTATTVVLGLYADAAGQPGTLLGTCALRGLQSGPGQWHECTLLAATASLAAGTPLWLAILAPAGGNPVRFRDTASGSPSIASLQTNLTALPARWVSGATYANAPAAAYGLGGK